MKKKLKSDLVSLAHKILKLDSESDYNSLKLEAQKIYEALSILAYVEANFDAAKPTIGKASIKFTRDSRLINSKPYAKIIFELLNL